MGAHEPVTDQQKPQRHWLVHMVWAVVVIVAFVVGSMTNGNGTASEPQDDPSSAATAEDQAIGAAVEECAASAHVEVLDGGAALSIDGAGEDEPGATIDEIRCILTALDVPDAVVSRMSRTRALDGTQDAAWGDLTASWTYHPDNGLDVIVEMSQ